MDFPGNHIGPEPTSDKFMALQHGKDQKIIKGNTLTVKPELPFFGLSQFGARFLNHINGPLADSPLLEFMNSIDTPVFSAVRSKTTVWARSSNLEQVFETVQSHCRSSEGDIPDVQDFRDRLEGFDDFEVYHSWLRTVWTIWRILDDNFPFSNV